MTGALTIIHAPVTTTLPACEDLALSANRRPLDGGSRAKQRDHRHTKARRKMQRPSVAGDENLRPLEHCQKCGEVGCRPQQGRVWHELPQFVCQQLLACAFPCRESEPEPGGGRNSMKGRPVADRPFLFGLTGRQMANHFAFGQDFFREPTRRRVRMNLNFQRLRWRNAPRRQNVQQPQRLVAIGGRRGNAPGVTEAASDKTSWMNRAQPLPRATEQAQKRTAVVASKSTERSKRSRRSWRMTG